MTPASFDQQLAYIHQVLEAIIGPDLRSNVEQTAMLLSIAESIKTARDHALNCARAHKLEEV